MRYICFFTNCLLQLLATTLNFYEIFPHWDFITTWGNELCNDDADTQDLCVALLGAVAGVNEKEMNKVLVGYIALNDSVCD